MTNARTMEDHIPATRTPSVTDQVVDRLTKEFEHQFSRDQVRGIVRRCVDDLAGTPPGAIPELGERLARQRLLDTEDTPFAVELTTT
ncbi:three-helix bundle dimerization domain-containing protein [Nocardia sp. NPDC052566]|uniref:three-helix bundle dimerization domain-containing protein n=1 Tax=Nocardia sp. NPDC052566 TaxID=3364330 RepID=UPI0037C7247D